VVNAPLSILTERSIDPVMELIILNSSVDIAEVFHSGSASEQHISVILVIE